VLPGSFFEEQSGFLNLAVDVGPLFDKLAARLTIEPKAAQYTTGNNFMTDVLLRSLFASTGFEDKVVCQHKRGRR
jgi:hypothetical protein